jgi:hypothetical protein
MIKKILLATAILMLSLVLDDLTQSQLLVRPATAQTATTKPNIVVIMGDDIGWFNLGAYNGGMMLNAPQTRHTRNPEA